MGSLLQWMDCFINRLMLVICGVYFIGDLLVQLYFIIFNINVVN